MPPKLFCSQKWDQKQKINALELATIFCHTFKSDSELPALSTHKSAVQLSAFMALYQIIIPAPRLAEASSVMRSQETLPRWNVDGTAPDCASLMAVDRGPDQNITICCMY